MPRYTCPTDPGPNHSVIIGCGENFTAEPDAEGLVDCPACGIWFAPTCEPLTIAPAVGKVARMFARGD